MIIGHEDNKSSKMNFPNDKFLHCMINVHMYQVVEV